MDNQNELFPVIDEEGNILGTIKRGDAHSGTKVLHPVVHLHVFNSKGELYLQHRPAWKDIQPDKWDTAVGGHIDYSECLDSEGKPVATLLTPVTDGKCAVEHALAREVREELGITDFQPVSMGHYVFEGPREREFVYVNRTVYDGPVCPSEDELAGGRFWSRDEIFANIGKGVFTPNFEDEYRKFFG